MDPYLTYYVPVPTDDTRNADHRGNPQPGLIRRPAGYPYPAARPGGYPAAAPVFVAAPMAATGAASAGILGNLDKAELARLLGEAIAALMPLPAAPDPKGDPETDIANQTKYIATLALFVKRSEQLRLLGDAIAAFLD